VVRRALILALVLGCFLLATLSLQQLEAVASSRGGDQQLLYLPNGKYMKLASLGQAPFLSDLVYLWAIQYYSNYSREDRFEFVEHVFSDVIAELDPHNVDPYWLGAMILSVEAGDDDSQRLLRIVIDHDIRMLEFFLSARHFSSLSALQLLVACWCPWGSASL
jgi:hypothetical protein